MLAQALVTITAGLLSSPGAPREDTPATRDEARALVARAVKAHGGEDKLAKLRAVRRKMRGTTRVGGNDVPVTLERLEQLPGRCRAEARLELNGQAITLVRVLDGDKVWESFNGALEEPRDALRTEMRDALHARRAESLIPLLKDKAFSLSPLGEVKVGGRPALGVKAACKGCRDVDLYFDKESGLLVKTAHPTVDDNGKEVLRECTYSDYKEADGLPRPGKVVFHHDGAPTSEWEVEEVEFVEQFDDREFAKP